MSGTCPHCGAATGTGGCCARCLAHQITPALRSPPGPAIPTTLAPDLAWEDDFDPPCSAGGWQQMYQGLLVFAWVQGIVHLCVVLMVAGVVVERFLGSVFVGALVFLVSVFLIFG